MIFNQMIYYDKNKFPLHAIGEVKEITEKDLKNATKIENHAFSYSDSLEKVIIPESVALIKDKAFYGSKNLKTIIIKGNNVKTLEDANAFGNSYISKLTQENITLQTSYRGSDYTRIYNGDPNDWGEAVWYDWHSGKLNNNMILTNSEYNINCVDYWYDVVTAGPACIYFKLPEARRIYEVNGWFTNSSSLGRSYRGLPQNEIISDVNLPGYAVFIHNCEEEVMNFAENRTQPDKYNFNNSLTNTNLLGNTIVSAEQPYGNLTYNYMTSNPNGVIGQFITIWAYLGRKNNNYVLSGNEFEIIASASTDNIAKNVGIFIDSEDPTLVEQYKNATNWSAYANLIKPISEYNE